MQTPAKALPVICSVTPILKFVAEAVGTIMSGHYSKQGLIKIASQCGNRFKTGNTLPALRACLGYNNYLKLEGAVKHEMQQELDRHGLSAVIVKRVEYGLQAQGRHFIGCNAGRDL